MFYATFLDFGPDFYPRLFEMTKDVFKMLSPILIPLIGVGMFSIVLRLILSRLVSPTSASGTTGLITRIVEKKKLIALLSSAVGAFLTWLALQPPAFQQGFMLPFQLLTGLVVSDKALYTLATTLFGIAMAVLFLPTKKSLK